jgi:hypothetical protein
MANSNIYESTLASVTILDTQSQGYIVQREIVCVSARSILLVVAIYKTEHLVGILP